MPHWHDLFENYSVGLQMLPAARDDVGMLPTGYDKDAAESVPWRLIGAGGRTDRQTDRAVLDLAPVAQGTLPQTRARFGWLPIHPDNDA